MRLIFLRSATFFHSIAGMVCAEESSDTAAISRRAEVAEIQMFRYFPSKFALFEQAVMAPLRAHFARFNADHGADVKPATYQPRLNFTDND